MWYNRLRHTKDPFQFLPLENEEKQDYLPLSHRHLKHTLLILGHHIIFTESIDIRDDRLTMFVDWDFGTGISNTETKVKYILDRLSETAWIDNKFE